ncbi:hypothetical protein ABEF95_015258 [Exophiala dermatitidis]
MDASASAVGRNGNGKRKYEHGPVMRVSSPFINTASSSYQEACSKPFNGRKFVFQPLATSNRLSGDDTSHRCEPPAVPHETTTGGPASAGQFTFVVSTADNFLPGQRYRTARYSRQTSVSLGDDGEPAHKRLRLTCETQQAQKPILRPSRPIAISDQVNSDIWQGILSYCDPKLLLKLKTINSAFYRLLSDRSAIWKQSRQNYFGADMPDCPQGLTEQQYVDLLAGRGCQSRTCPNENTTRVFWTFQTRLCPKCFKERTIRADDLPLQRCHSIYLSNIKDSADTRVQLWELLPMARSDGRRYMQPRPVDVTTNSWRGGSNSRHFAFLKSSYAQLEDMYLDFVASSPQSNDALKGWVEGVRRQTMAFMTEVQQIEAWYKVRNGADRDLQQVRIDFFETRAAQLSPPLQSRILWNMAAFRRVIRVPQAPSERSWNTLKAKILPYREQAEQVEQFKIAMAHRDHSRFSPSIRLSEKLHDHRSGRSKWVRTLQPEQTFVLELGQEVFARCLDDKVADEDLLLMCLNGVYHVYEQLKKTSKCPVGLNFDGTTGPYILTLDDARMIVEDVFMKEISPRSQRGETVFRGLRCRGCHRSDFIKTWSFTAAFEHILEAHSQQIGEGLEFWRFAVPFGSCKLRDGRDGPLRFPWYSVPWPKCLPLAPSHQETREMGHWHPDSNEVYTPLRVRNTISAFEGRQPRHNGLPGSDFVGNIVSAATALKGLWLDGTCQMKIALKYAADRYVSTLGTVAPISLLKESVERLRHANPAIELRFRCGVCVGDGGVVQSAKHVKYKLPIETLLIHWEEKHHNSDRVWSQNLMSLPSDSVLMERIEEADGRLQHEKDRAKNRTAELPSNLRKRPRLKGNVVMQTRLASEALDELFARRHPNPSESNVGKPACRTTVAATER